MLPGPTIIRECSNCQSPFKEWTMASGNTIGASWWTDGKMEARMLPNRDALVLCPECGKPLWIDEAKELARLKPTRYSFGASQPEEKTPYHDLEEQLQWCDTPTINAYLEALAELELDPDKEKYIRFRLWWRWNDTRRETCVATRLSEIEIENLERLIPLLDLSKEDGVLAKGEALRELGRFDECIALIDSPEARTESGYAGNILYWAEQHDQYVREIEELHWDFARSGWEKLKKQRAPFEIDPNGPPVFRIESDVWWVKVLGMLQHNWALVDELDDGSAIVYFFHDESGGVGRLKNRIAIIDSLEFDSKIEAMLALKLNGFDHAEEAGENIYLSSPEGVPYDARETSRRIYSEEGYWRSVK